MNSRQFFFISLIFLSIAMGINWSKIKPKKQQKVSSPQVRQAVSFEDLQLRDRPPAEEDEDDEEEDDEESNSNQQKNDDLNGDNNQNENQDSGENESSSPGELPSSLPGSSAANETEISDLLLKDDPIMQDYFKITRNPFEPSPYAKLVEELKLEAELAAAPQKQEAKLIKKVTTINNVFTGTIETENGLRAIIDGNLYSKGETYQQHKITEINNEVVIMDTNQEIFIAPKPGVEIDIDEKTGEYSIKDTFEQ